MDAEFRNRRKGKVKTDVFFKVKNHEAHRLDGKINVIQYGFKPDLYSVRRMVQKSGTSLIGIFAGYWKGVSPKPQKAIQRWIWSLNPQFYK